MIRTRKTAPNAVIYSTGEVTISRLNLVGIVAVTALSYALVPIIFG